jgi:tRNA-dihydrouridine synthase C
VTEFLRISQEVLPRKCFLRHAVELKSGSLTPGGVPVHLQLLGGHPERLALSALRAVELGAVGIDLNFGCPAPTVNSHDGGASILRAPERVEAITAAVRQAVPREIPVSAKIRLGWDDPNAVHEVAARVEQAGASWLTIHGRTKTQGYMPPAYWKPIGEVKRRLSIPVVANGEIWTLQDFHRCREETGAEHFMLGRGALANPQLAPQIAHALGILPTEPKPYPAPDEWKRLLLRFLAISEPLSDNPHYSLRRVKQWMRYVDNKRPFAGFHELKRLEAAQDLPPLLERLQFPAVSL